MQIDVIILSYAKNEALRSMTQQAIDSLLKSEDQSIINFNILVIESNKNLKPFCYKSAQTHYPRTKFNYNRYLNIGIKMSSASYVCIANNDLIFYKNWASELLKALNENPNLESVSPFCNIHHPSIAIKPNSGLIYGYEIRNHLAGWCIFFKRDLIQKIGYFDEKIKFWFSDNDYANTLQENKLQHALVTSSRVDHIGGVSTESISKVQKYDFTYGAFIYYDYKWNHKQKVKYWKDCFFHKLRIIKRTVLAQWKS